MRKRLSPLGFTNGTVRLLVAGTKADWGKGSGEAGTPITRLTNPVHDGEDEDSLRLFEGNDGVGEPQGERSTGGRIKASKAPGLCADFLDDPFDLTVEVDAKLRINVGVVADGLGELGVGLRVDRMGHRPAALRARASDFSKGIGWTLPL